MNKFCGVLFVFLFCGIVSAATNDRFGNNKNEIPRSSFTSSADRNVLIASAPVTFGQSGAIVLRYVYCTGVVSSTITIFNSMVFDGASSTKTSVIYAPTGFSSQPLWGSVYISSALSYDKVGTAPCTIGWDYTTLPLFGGVGSEQ